MSEIKVGYRAISGYKSTAYIDEQTFAGTDKYTDAEVRLTPTDDGWIESTQ